MFKSFIIGNLGANAELHSEQGSEFVTFKVAHNERYRDREGHTRETSVWVSCILNGRADNLLPYLVKGATVAVIGDTRLKTYHSAKMHQLVAGADLFVRSIDLVGTRPDSIPARLYDTDGIEHQVSKWYYCHTAKGRELLTASGTQFMCDANGWVSPIDNGNTLQGGTVQVDTEETQQADVFAEQAESAQDGKSVTKGESKA